MIRGVGKSDLCRDLQAFLRPYRGLFEYAYRTHGSA